MQSSIGAALAAFLLTGNVFVNTAVACPPGYNGYHGHQRPSGSGSPWAWGPSLVSGHRPTATYSNTAVVPTSTAAATTSLAALSSSVVVPSSSAAPTTSAVPVVTTTTTSSAVVVTPSPSSSSSSSSSTAVVVPATTASSSTAAAATTSAASAAGLTTDESNALSSQNSARSDVSEAALTWSDTLSTDAQSWADHLASLNAPGTLVHSSGTGQGENLYWQSNAETPFANAANAWVAEKSSYDGEAITGTGNFDSYGHYTQIIWKSSTAVGMAAASDGAGGYYVVARYTPEGNIIGETPTSS